ncbi:cobalt-precorrin-3B C(17)-methyltransferase [Klebsiella quasipneumoniae]|nr:cobalt-precorrin-3B C(17)-methyltransferase [Klebsiella quasipneumoniae]
MLSVIGIGPGSQAMMTMEAVEALQAAEIVVGYKTYTHLVKAFTGDKQVIKTGMCKEIERCQAAIELAQAGHNVALISSGDAGIYGMAGLVLELVNKQRLDIEVRLIPGMTASIAAASLLGAPLMHDFCHISLSDLLTPWSVIEKTHCRRRGSGLRYLFLQPPQPRPRRASGARLCAAGGQQKRGYAGWRGQIRRA